MYRKIEINQRMTMNEASEYYPNDYILMQMDDSDMFDPIGRVLYVGDDGDELFAIQVRSKIRQGLVVEGVNHQRSLGGIVVGQ